MAAGAVLPARAEPAAKPQLALEEFMGGTGLSASEIVRKSLERSGKFNLSPTVGQWLVRASSSAGRIDGALIATDGKILFNNHYDTPDLLDNAKAFADDIVDALTGERGIAFSRIAFVSDQSRLEGNLHVRRGTESACARSPGTGGSMSAPAWAPADRPWPSPVTSPGFRTYIS